MSDIFEIHIYAQDEAREHIVVELSHDIDIDEAKKIYREQFRDRFDDCICELHRHQVATVN